MRRLFGVGVLALPVMAFAAIPEAVETSLAEMAVDALAVAILILLAWVSFLTIRLLRKPLSEREEWARVMKWNFEADAYVDSVKRGK